MHEIKSLAIGFVCAAYLKIECIHRLPGLTAIVGRMDDNWADVIHAATRRNEPATVRIDEGQIKNLSDRGKG